MTEIRQVQVEGNRYSVVLSDEQEALSAAKAAGRAFVALPDEEGQWRVQGAEYGALSLDAAQPEWLERVVRRRLGLPWNIGWTRRLWLRELTEEDWPRIQETEVFVGQEQYAAYLNRQYGFYEYGLWAVVRREDSRLIGTAGVWDSDVARAEQDAAPDMELELGFLIFPEFRRQGYGREACQAVLKYVDNEYQRPVWALAEQTNLPSRALLASLGFTQESSGKSRKASLLRFRYAGCC